LIGDHILKMDSTESPDSKPAEAAIEPSEFNSPVQPFGWKGIDGWLVLPGIGLILQLIGLVIAIGILLTRGLQFTRQGARFLFIDVGLTVFTAYAAFRFFGKRRDTPIVMIILMIASHVSQLWLSIMDDAFRIGPLIAAIITSCIWIPYFLVSKRVKSTFVIR